jgi:spermidine/putrescine transport system substrate-binding protein
MLSLLAACGNPTPPPTPTPPPLAEELIFYDWAEDAIETVFEDFTEEYGVRIKYVTYESPEEAVENIRAGEVYDVVVLENQYIPALVTEGQLAEIDYRHVPNFKNISPNFRDLAYDPGNAHSIPYSWGTTGLVVRSDLVEEPVTSWADLWDQRYAGKVAGWLYPRYMLSAALKSMGYSINSEDPDELEAALERLIELNPDATWLEDEASVAPLLVSGDVVVALGWAYDVWTGQEENEAISYVLPKEGTILWGDNFVIPANSPNRHTAELFLDYLLRPEITGQIVNVNYYSMANDAAEAFIDPEILNDPIIYPPNEDLENAEIMLPLSPEGEKLYAQVWERFMVAGQ